MKPFRGKVKIKGAEPAMSMGTGYSIPLGKHVTYHGCQWVVSMQGMSTSHHFGANTGERYYWLIRGPGEVLMVPAHFLETEVHK